MIFQLHSNIFFRCIEGFRLTYPPLLPPHPHPVGTRDVRRSGTFDRNFSRGPNATSAPDVARVRETADDVCEKNAISPFRFSFKNNFRFCSSSIFFHLRQLLHFFSLNVTSRNCGEGSNVAHTSS